MSAPEYHPVAAEGGRGEPGIGMPIAACVGAVAPDRMVRPHPKIGRRFEFAGR
jgi:hypothetical protein